MRSAMLMAVLLLVFAGAGCKFHGGGFYANVDGREGGEHGYNAGAFVVFSNSPHLPSPPAVSVNRTDIRLNNVNVLQNQSQDQQQDQKQQHDKHKKHDKHHDHGKHHDDDEDDDD